MAERPPAGRNPALIAVLVVAVIVAVAAAIWSGMQAFKSPPAHIFPTEGGFPEGAGWVMSEGEEVPLSEAQAEPSSSEGAAESDVPTGDAGAQELSEPGAVPEQEFSEPGAPAAPEGADVPITTDNP